MEGDKNTGEKRGKLKKKKKKYNLLVTFSLVKEQFHYCITWSVINISSINVS